MDKRVIYITKKPVYGMLLDEWEKVQRCCNDLEEVFLYGIIEHHSQRKMLGIIPLPDKYTYKVFPHIHVRNKYTSRVSTAEPNVLSFESKKRLMEEKQNLESRLRNKCKQYKQSKHEE